MGTPVLWHGRVFYKTRPRHAWHGRAFFKACPCHMQRLAVELFYPLHATGLFSRNTRPCLGRHACASRACARVCLETRPCNWRGLSKFHCTRPCLTWDTPVRMNKFRIEFSIRDSAWIPSTDQDPNSIKTILNTLIWLIKIIEPKNNNRNQFSTDWPFQWNLALIPLLDSTRWTQRK